MLILFGGFGEALKAPEHVSRGKCPVIELDLQFPEVGKPKLKELAAAKLALEKK